MKNPLFNYKSPFSLSNYTKELPVFTYCISLTFLIWLPSHQSTQRALAMIVYDLHISNSVAIVQCQVCRLLLCVHTKSLQSCLTLCDIVDCSSRSSSVHGILQARILEWVAIFFSRGSSLTQGSNLNLLHWQVVSALQADSLPTEPSRKPPRGLSTQSMEGCGLTLLTASPLRRHWLLCPSWISLFF